MDLEGLSLSDSEFLQFYCKSADAYMRNNGTASCKDCNNPIKKTEDLRFYKDNIYCRDCFLQLAADYVHRLTLYSYPEQSLDGEWLLKAVRVLEGRFPKINPKNYIPPVRIAKAASEQTESLSHSQSRPQ